jgi:phosphate-selective porin OprO and OprP
MADQTTLVSPEMKGGIKMNRKELLIIATILSGLIAGLSRLVFAQQEATPDTTLKQRFEELEQKQRVLERKWELAQEESAAKEKATPVLVAGKEGFGIKSADGRFQMKLRGYVQADGRFFLNDETEKLADTFLMRSIRPIFEGTVDKNFDYYLMLDFGGGAATVPDAYIDFHYWSQARLRVGKMRAPFGLERLQSSANLLFIERSLPTNLSPNRDVGVQLHGELAKGVVTYAVGIFNGVADGGSADNDTGDEKDVVGRIFLIPFKNSSNETWQDLGLGIAGSSGSQKGSSALPGLASYKTPGQQTAFSYRSDGTAAGTTIADGKRIRLSPQGYYYNGSFGVFGEYVISQQEVAKESSALKLSHNAWQVAASYVLTGQKLAFKGVALSKPFEPKEHNWGAVELAVRYSRLNFDEDAFPLFADAAKSVQAISAWGAGINWYLNKNIKFSLNYEESTFVGGASTGDRAQEKAVVSRFQLSY